MAWAFMYGGGGGCFSFRHCLSSVTSWVFSVSSSICSAIFYCLFLSSMFICLHFCILRQFLSLILTLYSPKNGLRMLQKKTLFSLQSEKCNSELYCCCFRDSLSCMSESHSCSVSIHCIFLGHVCITLFYGQIGHCKFDQKHFCPFFKYFWCAECLPQKSSVFSVLKKKIWMLMSLLIIFCLPQALHLQIFR